MLLSQRGEMKKPSAGHQLCQTGSTSLHYHVQQSVTSISFPLPTLRRMHALRQGPLHALGRNLLDELWHDAGSRGVGFRLVAARVVHGVRDGVLGFLREFFLDFFGDLGGLLISLCPRV